MKIIDKSKKKNLAKLNDKEKGKENNLKFRFNFLKQERKY